MSIKRSIRRNEWIEGNLSDVNAFRLAVAPESGRIGCSFMCSPGSSAIDHVSRRGHVRGSVDHDVVACKVTFKELSSLRCAIPRAALLIRPPGHHGPPGPRERSSPGVPLGLWPAAPEYKVMLTAGECRVRADECQRIAETSSRVENILADLVRTWIRLALEVEQALPREP